MNPAVTFVVIVLAFGVAWYAAHSMGRYWTESKIVGGMTRLMVIASLALSALGFTGVYFVLILLALATFTTVLSPLDVHTLFPVSIGVLSMPGAGAVPSMWMNSQVAMQRGRVLGVMNNPGAGLRMDPGDVLDMTLNSRGLLNWVGDLFSGGGSGGGGDDDSGKLMLILVVIVVAIMALLAGVVTTILIVQAADKEHVGEIVELYKPGEAPSS